MENKKFIYFTFFNFLKENPAYRRVKNIWEILGHNGSEGIICSSFFSKKGGIKSINNSLNTYKIEYKSKVFLFLARFGFFNQSYVNLIKNYKPDFILLYNFPSILSAFIIFYCKKNLIKVVFDISEIPLSKNIIKNFDTYLRLKLARFYTDGLIVISNFLFRYFKRFGYKNNILIVPPLINKYYASKTDTPSKTINLIYAGNPGINKDNLEIVIKALNHSKNRNKFYLRIIGISKNDFLLKNQISEIDLKNLKVKFFGKLKHNKVVFYLKKSDFQLIIRTSNLLNNSGFPTKFVESFQYSLPVISTETSDISNYLVSGENGYLVDYDKYSLGRLFDKLSCLSTEHFKTLKNNIFSKKLFLLQDYSKEMKQFLKSTLG